MQIHQNHPLSLPSLYGKSTHLGHQAAVNIRHGMQPKYLLFIYLFWFLTLLSTHCIGHIMTGSFMGRGNQYTQLVKFLYCKLPTNSKQLPAFPLEVGPGFELRSQRWEARVFTTLPPWPLQPQHQTQLTSTCIQSLYWSQMSAIPCRSSKAPNTVVPEVARTASGSWPWEQNSGQTL